MRTRAGTQAAQNRHKGVWAQGIYTIHPLSSWTVLLFSKHVSCLCLLATTLWDADIPSS